MLVTILFGLQCLEPCALPEGARSRVEQELVRVMGTLGLAAKPAPKEAVRPTGPDALEVREDVARAFRADRAVALDFDPRTKVLWATWFTSGVVGPWRVSKIACRVSSDRLTCPGLADAVRGDIRPRRSEDVDVMAALRSAGRGVGRCVAREQARPLATRLFGRVDLSLVFDTTGRIRVASVAPARASKSRLGRCLRTVFGRIDVGAFAGEPIEVRVPVDL